MYLCTPGGLGQASCACVHVGTVEPSIVDTLGTW